ncbi:HNH endonuclease [Actinopolymorpha cephalotaxi]|uniref:HNH endonuclease n=1 Tax=Actinopolymorpha cephalotaxi TaxID=504797 RepID=A0A1I2S3Q3_9ACTN|nr:HNH endonuclease signature motif containing protein [Actinopolymorpha cephalotaxi]SFG47452.1 HNH endonuclease [Actinopolymorpha cephalotaxi]
MPDQADTGDGPPLPTSTSAPPDTARSSGSAGIAGATGGPDLAGTRGAPRSLEGLEAEICDLASRIAIATHEWLRLIVAFDRREGWRTSGCRSTAQWLSWRCGTSLSAAYEHLRVGRALENLPKVAAEFAAGRLSYSKVRALTRIADADQRSSPPDRGSTGDKTADNTADNTGTKAQSSNQARERTDDETADQDQGQGQGQGQGRDRVDARPGDDAHGRAQKAEPEVDEEPGTDPNADTEADAEDELLNLAWSATASQLDRIARGCSAARSQEQNHRRAMRRGIRWFYDEDGSLVIRGRLAPDEGATVVAALEAALDTLLAGKSAPSPAPNPPASPAPGNPTVPPASPTTPGPTASTTTPGPTVGTTGTTGSTDTMGTPSSTKPGDTADPSEDGRQSAPDDTGPDSSAEESDHPPHQTPPNTAPPRDTPRAVPHRHRAALAADALVLMAETLLSHTPAFLNSADKYRVIIHLHPTQPPKLTPATAPTTGQATPRPAPRQPASLDDGVPLAPDTADRLACESTVTAVHLGPDGQIRGLSDPTRYPRAATARAVRIRAHHTCQAPGCTTRHGLQIHHARHWSHGGPTTLANLVLICRYHHWLAHEGGHTFTARPGGHFSFHRPDGTEIPATPPLPGLTDTPTREATTNNNLARAVLDHWANLHPTLGEDVLTPPWWSGDPLDLHYAVSVILDAQATLN